MSSKRKTRSESSEPRKRQATQQEKEVISLLTPDKALNSDEQKQNDNTKNNTTNNENNSNKTEQDNSNSKKEEDLQCGICLDKPSVQGKLDSCTHMFCFECIEHWSKTANTCPFCKARFKQLIKIDLQNPENNKKMKKVRVRHADQRPEYDDPEEWIVYDDDGYEDEDGWLDDDLASWGIPWPAPQSLPGNFWTQFLAGSLPEAFEADADDFIDDGGRDDFIDLTDEPEYEDDFLDYEDEPSDDFDIGNIDISSLVREVFHPYSRLAAQSTTTTTSRRRSSSSRIRNLQAQMRNSRSSTSRNNTNNTNNRNNSNNNNSQRTSSQRDSAISARTRSQSSNNSNNRHLRSNTQRNNTNNRSTRRS